MPADKEKKKGKTGRQNYPWGKIKHYYVTSPDATLRKVAEKYGISYFTVAKKSKADNWFADRAEHQKSVVSKAISKTADRQADALAKEMEFLDLIKGHVTRILNDEQQFQRQILINPLTGETVEKVTEKADARALKDTMQTIKMIEEMSRSLYNVQKAEAIQKSQIEAERMQLERERFEFEKQKAEFHKPDASNSIRISGMEPEWSE